MQVANSAPPLAANLAPLLVSADEAARLLGFSRRHITNRLARGLPSVPVGGRRMFRPDQLSAWLDELQRAQEVEKTARRFLKIYDDTSEIAASTG